MQNSTWYLPTTKLQFIRYHVTERTAYPIEQYVAIHGIWHCTSMPVLYNYTNRALCAHVMCCACTRGARPGQLFRALRHHVTRPLTWWLSLSRTWRPTGIPRTYWRKGTHVSCYCMPMWKPCIFDIHTHSKLKGSFFLFTYFFSFFVRSVVSCTQHVLTQWNICTDMYVMSVKRLFMC